MFVFPLSVGGKGPTISKDTTCQGLPACSLCLCGLTVCLPCFAAWQTSQEFTSLLVSAVRPGQYQSCCTLLVVLSIPIWPCLWTSQIVGSRSCFGHTTDHLSFPDSWLRILNIPARTSIRGRRLIRRASSASPVSMVRLSGATPVIKLSLMMAIEECGVSCSCSNSAGVICGPSDTAVT